MKTNFMHCLSVVYFIKQPVHVSGIFIAHHQEVFTVYVQQLVHVINSGACLLVGSGCNWFHPDPTSEYLLMMGNKYARNM
jgi:hypothetical protein